MIGPHQGKELELMLTGEKHLAVFHDVIPDDHDISEEIIPEQAFAPYVQQGKIKRFSSEIYLEKYKKTVRYVCFALPGEEWRAQFFLWQAGKRSRGEIPADDACDIIAGRLLGYSETDIQHFLENQKIRLKKL